jgi:hypothetical protein
MFRNQPLSNKSLCFNHLNKNTFKKYLPYNPSKQAWVGMMGLLFHNGHQMYNLDILSIPLDHLISHEWDNDIDLFIQCSGINRYQTKV